MKDEMISKKKFQPGDKFILEIGEKRMALDEYEIVGTDLWVWGSLLEKLTPYNPDHNVGVNNMVDRDTISRQAAIDTVVFECGEWTGLAKEISKQLRQLPLAKPEITLESAIDYLHSIGWMQEHDRILTESAQPEIIRCKDCKHWNQATAYHGGALSFGFCESDDMWRSLYGETTEIAHIDTDDDFFCGFAER